MAKVRMTVTMDEDLMWAVRIAAARTGKDDSQVIEDALRRNLGVDLLSRMQTRSQMPEDEAMALAVEAQHAARRAGD
jgi:metal-responsive CopG/Arc/MetJ family transcriptional regulator